MDVRVAYKRLCNAHLLRACLIVKITMNFMTLIDLEGTQ